MNGSIDKSAQVSKLRGVSRFVVIALVLHLLLFVYPVLRLCDWLDLSWQVTLIIFLPLVSSQILTSFYLKGERRWWVKMLRRIADFFLGISPVLLGMVLIGEAINGLSLMPSQSVATVTISVTLIVGAYATWAAIVPKVCKIELSSDKIIRPIRFVQISDIHIGSRRPSFLERVIFMVNELKPDFLCITGDLIDERGIPASDLKSLKSVVGPVYYTIGNHEKYEDLDDIVSRLNLLGVTVLRNSTARYSEELQVIGIDDMDDADQVKRQLMNNTLDRSSLILLLYHRPLGLIASARAGVDLMLSGHTHNGQIMPFNLVVGRVFDMVKGLYEYAGTKLYVSQGTGTWGPVMRLGTRGEITLFEITSVATFLDRS